MAIMLKLLAECKDGEVLAQNVYSAYNKNLLVTKNTQISEDVKIILHSNGIEAVHVYNSVHNDAVDSLSYQKDCLEIDRAYFNCIDSVKKLMKDTSEGVPLDCSGIEAMTDELFIYAERFQSSVPFNKRLQSIDNYLFTHSVNVAVFAYTLADWMKLSDIQARDLVTAGLLHDIGKSKVSSEILNKREPLTDEEFAAVRLHPTLGYNIVSNLDWLNYNIKRAIIEHHEREDGSGYPYKLKSAQIHFYSKIIAIADVYDALTSDKVYRQKMTPFKAFKEFERSGLGIFNIDILHTFLVNLAQSYLGSKVLLNTGETGEIVFISPRNISTPIVKIGARNYDLFYDKEYEIAEILSV